MKSATSLLLKQKQTLFDAAFTPATWNRIAAELIVVSILGLALFGVVMGSYFPHWWYPLSLAWRMVVLIYGPIVLCTPALFVFSAIRGSRLTLTQLVYLLVGSLATIGLVLLALAPISWFFTWTDSSVDHEVLKVLNGGMIVLAIIFGVTFLAQGMNALYRHIKTTDSNHTSAIDILIVWLILLLIVTVQMSAKLGPWYQ